MGLLSFLFIATVFSWVLYTLAVFIGLPAHFHRLVELLFGIAMLAGIYGVINASWTRVTRITVRLANLPAAWQGRKAALISDLHLGPIRNGNFLRRMIATILREEPHAIFIAGDLYDGTAIDAAKAAAPSTKTRAVPGYPLPPSSTHARSLGRIPRFSAADLTMVMAAIFLGIRVFSADYSRPCRCCW